MGERGWRKLESGFLAEWNPLPANIKTSNYAKAGAKGGSWDGLNRRIQKQNTGTLGDHLDQKSPIRIFCLNWKMFCTSLGTAKQLRKQQFLFQPAGVPVAHKSWYIDK